MAAQGNHEEVARLLIMRGASVEDKTGVSSRRETVRFVFRSFICVR